MWIWLRGLYGGRNLYMSFLQRPISTRDTRHLLNYMWQYKKRPVHMSAWWKNNRFPYKTRMHYQTHHTNTTKIINYCILYANPFTLMTDYPSKTPHPLTNTKSYTRTHITSTYVQLVNATFTLSGDCRATGCDSANHHWSLVVAPSPRLVANVRRTVSKRHGNEKKKIISATKWTVVRLSGIVETQSCWSCATNMQKKHDGSMAGSCECTTTMSQLSPNSGVTNGDCNGEMACVRDNGATNSDYITATLLQK